MSSYLSFYLKPKVKEGSDVKVKPMMISSFCRSSEIYQHMHDELNIAWCGNEEVYTDVSADDLNRVISELNKSINNLKDMQKRQEMIKDEVRQYITDLSSQILTNIDDINKVKSLVGIFSETVSDMAFDNSNSREDDEYMGDLLYAKQTLEIYRDMLNDFKYCSDFDGMCCNID